jgi:hypothetical protein
VRRLELEDCNHGITTEGIIKGRLRPPLAGDENKPDERMKTGPPGSRGNRHQFKE